ncbi:NUDIX hydrolase [Candidatus Woesearchaeota archaeon]|nr:NUDIX hydrolase [Candidatus Woesearchaeota archaeon]
MKTYFVVTAVVKHKDKVLILKKSKDDWNYPNRWSFCSGYVQEFEAAEDTVLREIKEETGLKAKITGKGRMFQKDDRIKGKRWIITVFLCEVESQNVRLDRENVDFRWIGINELRKYPTVPGLKKDLKVLGLI